MNRKNKIALLLVLVLGAITFWLVMNNNRSTIKESLRDFAFEDTASITKIFLADKENHTITLQKIKQGAWKLNDKYWARQDAVNLLLYTIKMLEVKEPVRKKARENVIKNLASKAIKIEMYQGDKLVKVYYVGGETPDHLGTYMLLVDHKTGENSSVPFVMYIPGFEGYLTTRYFTNLSEWRDRTVFSYVPTQIKSVKVEFMENPASSYAISIIENNKFELKQLQNSTIVPVYDTLAVKQYLSYYQSINYEVLLHNVVEKATKDSILTSTPVYQIELTDKDGNINTVKLYHKSAQPDQLNEKGEPLKYDLDRMYASINNGDDFAMVQYFVFGKLLPPIDYFLKEKSQIGNKAR